MRMLFIIATLATFGSMYFGYYGDPVINFQTGERFNINNALPVCDMCWYIRICTYPLFVILLLALLKKDLHSLDYVLPLALIGLFFSAYKYWLQKFQPTQDTGLCLSQVSCSDIAVEYFGFMTMPFFGIISFLAIIGCILRIKRSSK